MSAPLTGVVVATHDVGESHRIVRLLTPDRGRVSLLARGARASTRRFAGVLEIGNVIQAQSTPGRGDLATMTEADRIHGPRRARRDLDRLAYLAYGCELCGSLAMEEQGNEKLFQLLEVWLELLEGEASPGIASRVALEGKALTFAGFPPQLRRCVACGEPLDEPLVFDARSGGAAHARCGGGAVGALLDTEQIEVLRRTPLHLTLATPAPNQRSWLTRYVGELIGRPLQAATLVQELERDGL